MSGVRLSSILVAFAASSLAAVLCASPWLRVSIVVGAAGIALVLLRLTLSRLGRRLAGSAEAAERWAERISGAVTPPGAATVGTGLAEFDTLLSRILALRLARDSLAERERMHRRSPEARIAEAIVKGGVPAILTETDGRQAQFNVPRPLLQHLPPDESDVLTLSDGRRLLASRFPLGDEAVATLFTDVTSLSLRQQELEKLSFLMSSALENLTLGFLLFDAAHRLLVVNRRYHEIFRLVPGIVTPGLSAREVLHLNYLAGSHPGCSEDELIAFTDDLMKPEAERSLVQHLADGQVIAIEMHEIVGGGFVATYEDVTERWNAEARIAHIARHDTLTDLPNRLLLRERIEGAVTLARREIGFALFCLDLDNFKQINDTLGHAVGDELLRAVAHRLAACLREVDTVARLGGDEFAIVQAAVKGPEDAATLAHRILAVISAPYALTHHSVTVGVSIGIALAPGDGLEPDRLMQCADVALYRAKDDGRGVFRFFEVEMDARLQARRSLELDLRAAFEAQDFDLYYQPIYDLARKRICGFEALLRWTHPIRGRVSPAEFVPLAEEIGLIVPLGEWVLRRACREASGWPDELKVAVNVSAAQFTSTGLIDTVREVLAESGLQAHRLELEVTEGVLLVNRPATVAILHGLRDLGTRIAMDDFGTGYSSLSYLRSFPFDKMKIDQSFIRDLTVDRGSGFIVRAVIDLASSLGMTTTAEGVETEEQLARLGEEGCDEVQGYLFSPPVPADRLPLLLATWNGRTCRAA